MKLTEVVEEAEPMLTIITLEDLDLEWTMEEQM